VRNVFIGNTSQSHARQILSVNAVSLFWNACFSTYHSLEHTTL